MTRTITEALVKMHIENERGREKVDGMNLEMKHALIEDWKKHNSEHADNFYSQSRLPLYELGMLGICQLAGIAFTTDTMLLFTGQPRATLESIGKFVKESGKFLSESAGKYILYTRHESPRHRLQFEQQKSQMDHSSLQQKQQEFDRLTEQTYQLIQTISQYERGIISQ